MSDKKSAGQGLVVKILGLRMENKTDQKKYKNFKNSGVLLPSFLVQHSSRTSNTRRVRSFLRKINIKR